MRLITTTRSPRGFNVFFNECFFFLQVICHSTIFNVRKVWDLKLKCLEYGGVLFTGTQRKLDIHVTVCISNIKVSCFICVLSEIPEFNREAYVKSKTTNTPSVLVEWLQFGFVHSFISVWFRLSFVEIHNVKDRPKILTQTKSFEALPHCNSISITSWLWYLVAGSAKTFGILNSAITAASMESLYIVI